MQIGKYTVKAWPIIAVAALVTALLAAALLALPESKRKIYFSWITGDVRYKKDFFFSDQEMKQDLLKHAHVIRAAQEKQGRKTNRTVFARQYKRNIERKVDRIYVDKPVWSLAQSDISCAVVGNSGNLKGAGYGSLIDSHDVVVRFNNAPTKGFEKDVGTKSTVRFVNRIPYRVRNIKSEPETHFVLRKSISLLVLPDNKKYGAVSVLSDGFEAFLNERVVKEPSTGIYAVWMALSLCADVSLFGFGANKEGIWDHYFNESSIKRQETGRRAVVADVLEEMRQKGDWHNRQQEAEALEALEDLGLITRYRGNR